MKKILLVEYDESFRSILKGILQKNGYDVVAAPNGLEAQKCFEKNQFDLVVLEIRIPTVSGMELLYWIRKQSSVPVILIPALIQEKELKEVLLVKRNQVVPKPFKCEEILSAIERA